MPMVVSPSGMPGMDMNQMQQLMANNQLIMGMGMNMNPNMGQEQVNPGNNPQNEEK